MNIDNVLAKGFGVDGIYYGDIDPDFLGGVELGVASCISNRDRPSPRPMSGAPSARGHGD